MSDLFNAPPERADTRFRTPEDELSFLRAQVAEKERQLREAGHHPEREALVHEELQRYKDQQSHEVLHDSHTLAVHERDRIALDLEPDEDDTAMYELMSVVTEKGIKNALSVAEQLHNSHLEDDFHRMLVQYVAQGFPVQGLSEGAPLWDVLHLTLYEVTLPEPNERERERPLKEVVSAMEQFYYGMLALDSHDTKHKRHYTFEVAVSSEREDICFYMAVPKDRTDLFEKQLLSVFPKARAHAQPNDYNIFLHEGYSATAVAYLSENGILPLKDYQEFDHDPLTGLISSFTKIATVGEGAAVQFVIHPAGDRFTSRYHKVLDKLERGKKLKDALKDTPDSLTGEFMKTFREFAKTSKTEEEKRKEREDERVDQATVDAVRRKVQTPIAGVSLRIIASASSQARADAILSDIASSFQQFRDTNGNDLRFERTSGKAANATARKYTYRETSATHEMPLSLRELTSLIHFPTHVVAHTPQLKRVQSALAPAPMGLPHQGTRVGINSYRGVDTPIFLTDEDRLRHLYVIGQTGTGKSGFLRTLIRQDIERGAGLCFIDPHGTDVEEILEVIPEHRMQDVIYFDPADTQSVLGLNMLEYDPRRPEQKTFVINELFSIFKKLYSNSPESMGPAFEQYFRNATALVMEDPATGNTMLDISRVLADAKYREVKLSRSKNPVVNQFWREIATKAQGEASLANIVPYITNKFDIFTANDIMRPIIAQQTSAFRMREVMDSRKILLVNLSKGLLGDINANLIGMVLVGKILMAALSRVDALQSDLPHFYLYIDEFQNISTDSISAILSEARKYKLSLNVAHQFIAQLDEGIRDAVFGNVGSMATFRVGYEDAEFLENQYAPVFATEDIMNIENRHAYVRLLANGVPQKPFSIKTLNFEKGSPERALAMKQRSAQQYGRSREEVEQEVTMRYGIGV